MMTLEITIKGGASEFHKKLPFSGPDPKQLDELFCAIHAHLKFNTPKEVEVIGEACESCSA